MTVTANKPGFNRVQVYVLVENRLVRDTLVRLIHKRSDLCVVGQGCSTEAIDILNPQCDIFVLDDLEMASLLGSHLLDRAQAISVTGIVLIDMQDDTDEFIKAVRSGVSGYLLNDASANDVVSAICAVARGEAVCPPRLCLALFHFVVRSARDALVRIKQRSMHGLTIRQQQLISLVARGLTNKEIASQLNLSEFTVKNHLHRIMKQVEAESRQEMVRAARASGYAVAV